MTALSINMVLILEKIIYKTDTGSDKRSFDMFETRNSGLLIIFRNMSMSSFLAPYEKLRHLPLGRWLFSQGVGWRAPYFASIRPYVAEYRRGQVEVRMADRRAITTSARCMRLRCAIWPSCVAGWSLIR